MPTEEKSPVAELAALSKLAADLRGLIASQKDLLQRAGLRIPPGVLEGLDYLADRLRENRAILANQAQELQNLRALAEISHVVNSSLDLTTVLNEVMDTLVRLTGAERGFLMLRDESGQLNFRIARNMSRESLDQSESEISRTIVERVARDGEPVVTTNAQEDPRFGGQESVVAYSLRSILCVPLKVKGVLTGVIYADNRVRTGLFTERERDLLASFANQAAVALENARLFESVKQTLAEVTELKSLMDNVFASIASGVITADIQDRITLVNSAAENILGVAAERLRGLSLSELLPPLDPGLPRRIEDVKAADRRFVGIEVNPTLPERGTVNLSLSLSPLKDADQVTGGVAIVVDDLTETKRLRSKYEIFQRMVSPAVIESLPDDPSQLKLGGLRQEVTVLFADVRGFSTFSEHLDPVRLLDVLNSYLGMGAEAVLLQEGTLDKFMGDAIMALFNAPLRQPDHTLRAVHAALKMKRDIESFHETVDPQFRLGFGIGINAGTAVVGMVGARLRLDYSAIGDDVNLAKRIQEISGRGQILISHAAYERVAEQVNARALGPVRVKGREQPVEIYELLGLRG